MFEILETERRLFWTGRGRLAPWLGPALRGTTAYRLKIAVCRQPAAERDTRWEYCKGCPFMNECVYGGLFEPDPPPDVRVFAGQEDAARPLTIVAPFPAPLEARPGQSIALRTLFVGRRAIEGAGLFWRHLAEAGADPDASLGTDHTGFEVWPPMDPANNERRTTLVLPHTVDLGRFRPRIRLDLTGPLLLRTTDAAGKRHLVKTPSFAQLLTATLRTLGPMSRLYGTAIPDEVFGELKDRASAVRTVRSAFRPFQQPKESNRSRQRSMVMATIGWAEFADVPEALATWLEWGGRLGVGSHRVAGAGTWQIRTGD